MNTKYGYIKQATRLISDLPLTPNEVTARRSRGYASSVTRLRLVISLLLFLVLGSGNIWGQEGVWYIANDKGLESETSFDYNTSTTAERFYIVPAKDPVQADKRDAYYSENYDTSDGDPEKPYLTTYRTNRDVNSAWVIKSAGNNKYFLIHVLTGKYAVYHTTPDCTSKSHRKVIHLEALAAPENVDIAKFYIENGTTTYTFRPQSLSTSNRFFNPSNGNRELYHANGGDCNNAGLIGVFNEATNRGSKWHIEEAQLTAPTISNLDDNNIVTVTDANGLPDGYNIRYTTDGSTPTASSPIMEDNSYTVTSSVTLKAVVERYGIVLTEVAEKAVAPAPCATPVITFDYTTSNVSISCTTPNSTIYYTTDGSIPTTSSTAYSAPFSVDGPTTVKAFATHTSKDPSAVAELAITQVAMPTIQNNGSNAISITTTTPDATIYYTTDGSTPTTASTVYSSPLTDNVSNVTIKAIAVKENMITSAVGSGTVKLQCATPVITRDGMTFTLSCSMPTNANLYYTLGGGAETLYSGPVAFTGDQLPTTVTAVARHSNYTESEEASMELKNGEGTPDDPYLIYGSTDFTNFVTNVNNGTTASASYKLGSDVSASGTEAITTAFTGTFDGGGYTISNLGHPLFNTVDGGVIKNVILDAVSISGGANTGAIANKVTGTSAKMGSVYSCGVLSGNVSGSGYVGSIVGQLGDSDADNCYARVINCFSYATVSGGSDAGGIVGYNSFASTAANIRTMVMNCMYYGDITGGTNVSPVYGGEIINNLQGGLSNFNYYAYTKLTTATINKYNNALSIEDKFLNRFEYYRLLLNSNKKLAAFYATGSHDNANQKMLKWVLETANRTIDNPKPYPILKTQGYYPSIINPDFKNAPDSASVGRNHGGKLGSKTLSVTINSVGSNAPSGANITTGSLTLTRTDKDFDRFNFNYDKVQLPYYNDVGTGNYTEYKVVTGWKITAITAIEGDPYTSANYPTTGITDFPNHNYADRKSSNKDLYSVSKRVFSQGAYFEVPYGVTSITIEPYWGQAAYISDQNYDVVYKDDYTGKQNVTQTGTQINTFNEQTVHHSMTNALNALTYGSTVYDKAVVLVGNLHLDGVPSGGDKAFTMMSVDEDNDHEPDYSLIYHHKGRTAICPIRFDFLNIPGTAQAQKPNGADLICNFTIFKTKGWFEVTNTSSFYSSQLEYENLASITKTDAPLILLGGVIDQFVSTQSSTVDGKTIYIHVGGNVWIHEFGMGTHSDGSQSTPHVPVSVTGGEFPGFYLTGTYKADAQVRTDNAECYISGGYIHEAAGASLEQINGNVRWQIYNADIDEFFGGGINDAKPIKGDITTDIFNSHVTLFCGGPKFGNMQTGKKVTTNAEGCTFGKYFGAGYGGLSYSKKKYYDKDDDPVNWTTLQSNYTNDRGKYYDGKTTELKQGATSYGFKGPGVATDFDYEYFVWTSGKTGGRFYVKFASFSLAQCNDVVSTLKNCTVETNFYGGGNLGKVVGTATSVLEDCIVKGSVYGAGYSASIPTVEVRDAGFTKNPNYNSQSGMFEPAEFSGTTTFTWQNATAAGKTLTNGQSGSDLTNHILYTDIELTGLGEVAKTVLTIDGTTTVRESVYGGGEESGVGGDTEVTVNSGAIGIKGESNYGYKYGNVYGGGKGKIDNEGNLVVSSVADLDAGLVKGNTSVTIKGTTATTTIAHNVYGGGAVGSVGTFTRDANGMPTGCTANTGNAVVIINGGLIGHNREDTGMINGSSRGWEGNAQATGSFLNQLAWVNNAEVFIGDSLSSAEDKGPVILGSIYGGGENGHNLKDAVVRMYKGTVGNSDPSANTYNCGNVYGAGCGTDTYWDDANGNSVKDPGEELYNPLAGVVRGNATVIVKGGHVLRNVYGAGAMGSVGNEEEAEGSSTSGKTTVTITGNAKIGADDGNGNIYGAARGDLNVQKENFANVRTTEVEISGNADIKGSVFGGGEAGIVWEGVTVNMLGGTVAKDLYGGGALADTQLANNNEGNTPSTYVTTVNLKGGTINHNAYGGGLGTSDTMDDTGTITPDGVQAMVYGDVILNLNEGVANTSKGCIVKGSIFGCNNLNGTPKGNVTVHIHKTQNAAAETIANPVEGEKTAKVMGRYDVTAVYGGGNLSAYEPKSDDATARTASVIIDGCELTSICQVYGGGNAASTPATNVTVNGTYEIMELFGGGNGQDDIIINSVTLPNPGANVGYKNYSEFYKDGGVWKVRDKEDADTKEKRQAPESPYVYGSGAASVDIHGGTIHRVFGGSNTKGNVRQTAVTMLEDASGCPFKVDEAYGGGKSASMDAEAKLLMACIPGLNAVYGGAEDANIHGDVELTITNGTFDRVFGGNNKSGQINGSITVNIEEVGCRPIIIGELYGGGNLAPYSIYGYNTDGTPKESGANPSDDPEVNVKSFTSIGTVYGGGYGAKAVMVGSPTVNINEVADPESEAQNKSYIEDAQTKYYSNFAGDIITIDGHEVIRPSHVKGKMGAINSVFGGGNAAPVKGNTTVNVGTAVGDDIYMAVPVAAGTDLTGGGYYTKSGNDYVTATGEAVADTTYYKKYTVLGVDIRDNIYGGGNNAEVTGSTNVNIGKKEL